MKKLIACVIAASFALSTVALAHECNCKHKRHHHKKSTQQKATDSAAKPEEAQKPEATQ